MFKFIHSDLKRICQISFLIKAFLKNVNLGKKMVSVFCKEVLIGTRGLVTITNYWQSRPGDNIDIWWVWFIYFEKKTSDFAAIWVFYSNRVILYCLSVLEDNSSNDQVHWEFGNLQFAFAALYLPNWIHCWLWYRFNAKIKKQITPFDHCNALYSKARS